MFDRFPMLSTKSAARWAAPLLVLFLLSACDSNDSDTPENSVEFVVENAAGDTLRQFQGADVTVNTESDEISLVENEQRRLVFRIRSDVREGQFQIGNEQIGDQYTAVYTSEEGKFLSIDGSIDCSASPPSQCLNLSSMEDGLFGQFGFTARSTRAENNQMRRITGSFEAY